MFIRRFINFVKYAYRLIKVNLQLLYGIWKISKLPHPLVSIFGGARVKKGDPYFTRASELANRLTQYGVSVLTGGGPGIMEAANCGAISTQGASGKSIGIGVRQLEERLNPCVQESFILDYFFARKWLLTRFSDAFVIFPGGFGTMDELSEILTLIQTKKMKPVPIVLIGKEYWNPFLKWITDEAIDHGLIAKKDLKLFIVTDDLEQAFCTILESCAI